MSFFGFHVLFFILLLGEKYGSSSFRKRLKLARISFETAGTYRIVARGKYCQFEKEVEVRVVSKYHDNTKASKAISICWVLHNYAL